MKEKKVILTAFRNRCRAVFTAGLLIILAGCQETPKESIVKQKSADNIKNYESNEEVSEKDGNEPGNQDSEETKDSLDTEEAAEEKEGKINEIVKAPKSYKNQMEYEGGKITVDTDAEIVLPKVDAMNT